MVKQFFEYIKNITADIVSQVYEEEYERMTVKKVKGGYATVHCHGEDKGKIISKFPTKAKAMSQHRAIQASKSRRGK